MVPRKRDLYVTRAGAHAWGEHSIRRRPDRAISSSCRRVPHQEINASMKCSNACLYVPDNEAVVVNLDITPVERRERSVD